MASRSERRDTARMEARIKLTVAGIIALAFLISGASGSATIWAAAVLAVAIAIAGVVSLLILNSRLVIRKKAGLILVIAGGLTAWFWAGARAPRQWTEERATIIGISGGSAVTETDYSYRPDQATKLTMTQTKTWTKISEARKYRPAAITIYFNRLNPQEFRVQPTNGWVRALATPEAARVRVTQEATATIRIGSALFPGTATVTGDHVANHAVGASIRVWINPVLRTEVSFEPRATEGGQKYWIAALAAALTLGGMMALILGRAWKDLTKLRTERLALHKARGGPASADAVSVGNQLRAIDWFQFEAVSARIMEADGWTVQRSGGANPDGGADLVAMRNGRKAVVQCKHWRRVEVQPRIIRELIGTRTGASFAADEAILFTLSDCTTAALACAQENNVVIFNSKAITTAVERIGIGHFPELSNPDDKRCPKCSAAMVRRENVETPFWGCSTYPRCRGTIEIA